MTGKAKRAVIVCDEATFKSVQRHLKLAEEADVARVFRRCCWLEMTPDAKRVYREPRRAKVSFKVALSGGNAKGG